MNRIEIPEGAMPRLFRSSRYLEQFICARPCQATLFAATDINDAGVTHRCIAGHRWKRTNRGWEARP